MTMSFLENLFAPGTIERLGWMLVHVLWQATAVALLLAVFLRLLRSASANVRYGAACSALALMVILPLVTMRYVKTPGPVAEAGPAPVAVVLPALTEGTTPQRGFDVLDYSYALNTEDTLKASLGVPPTVQAPGPMTPILLRERIVSVLEPALPYVVLGWLIGVFGLSAWHLGGWTQLQRLKRRMVREIGDPLQRRLEDLSARLGLHRAVGLLESALVEVPTVVGWLRPVILLPASALTGLRPEQLEAILAHELAHIRRYDYLVNMLQTVVEILGFYHPAIWWVSHRIREERENCCDDLAVCVCGSSLQYAKALACMEEIRHGGTDLAVAATGGSLMGRIARLLGRPVVEDRRFAWLPGLVALLLVAGIVIPSTLVIATARQSQPVATTPADTPAWAKASLAALPGWEMEHLDTAPSVTVDGREGFRLIVKQYQHVEIVVFPGGGLPAHSAIGIGWTQWEDELPCFKKVVHLGHGMGMNWYANATIYDQERLRQKLNLQGGDDRLALLTEALLVRDQGMTTRNSCVHLLAAAGDKAIPYIKSAVEGQPDGAQAIYALAFIQTDAATQYLQTLYQAESTRVFAEYALIHEPPRPAAKEQYLDMLQRRRYVSETAKACVQFRWKEAIPLLEARFKQAHSLNEFEVAFCAKRTLEGRPVPAEIDQAQEQLQHWVYSEEPPTREDLTATKETLLRSSDVEAAIVMALGVTMRSFMASDERTGPIQEVGREVLRELPRKETAGIIQRLAESLAQNPGTEGTVKRLLEILPSESSEPSGRVGEVPTVQSGSPSKTPAGLPVLPPTQSAATQAAGDPAVGRTDTQEDYQTTRQGQIALLSTPEVPLHEARTAIRLFQEHQDWDGLALAYQAAAQAMWRASHQPVEAFTRPVPPPQPPVGRSPVCEVQTELDGVWHPSRSNAASWTDWIRGKQKDLVLERIRTLTKLGELCSGPLHSPARAIEAYQVAGWEVPLCSEPLGKLIPQIWPKRTVSAQEVLALDAVAIRIQVLDALADAQLAAGGLHEAAETRLRAMLANLLEGKGDWNSHGPEREAEAFWQIVRRLPPDEPLPPTLWLNILDRDKPALDFPAPESGPHGLPYSFAGPRLVVRPGQKATTLTIAADMETPGGSGGVRCFTMIAGKVHDLGSVRWHADNRPGREWRTATFDVPENVGVIRLEITPYNNSVFHIHELKVSAAFAPARAAPASPSSEGTATQADEKEADTGRADAAAPNASDQMGEVLLQFQTAKVRSDLRPDRETSLLLANALGVESPLARELGRPGRQFDMTVGEILKRYIAPQSLSQSAAQALLHLLESRGYLDLLSAPNMVAQDNKQARIRITTKEHFWTPSKLERIWYGMAMDVTPHLTDDNRVALDLMVELRDPVPGVNDSNQPKVSRTSAETSMIAPNDRYLIWAATEQAADQSDADKGRQSLYIIVKPTILQPAPGYAGPAGVSTPAKANPRQVLLDIRTVTMERGGLSNLNVEWGWPTVKAGVFHDGAGTESSPPLSGWPRGVQIGYTPDQTFTDSLLMALNLLQENGQAQVSGQQILAQDGRKCQIKALTDEWYTVPAQTAKPSPSSPTETHKVETGTAVTIAPRVGNNGDITLEAAIEVSTSLPRKGGTLPLVSRRTAKSAVTIRDGGTVAVAGLTENRTGPSDKSVHETAIFVTAHLIPDANEPARPASPSAEPATQAPQVATDANGEQATVTAVFADADLLIALAEMSQRTGVQITADATVKTTPVTAEFTRVPLETALPRILKNTPYKSRKLADGTYLAFRPLSFIFPQVELVPALRDVAVAAGVPIIPDPNVTGLVNVTCQDVSLDEALQMLLAGKPYVFKKMTHYYLVTSRSAAEVPQTRRVQPTSRPTQPTAEKATPTLAQITATFENADLRDVLAQIGQRAGVEITPDLTVQPTPVTTELVGTTLATALRQVLRNTPYAFEMTGDGTVPVFRPLSNMYFKVGLVQALQDLSTMADVPIVAGPDVTGMVNVWFTDVSLDTALEMLLAGKPYVFRKMPHYYLVADVETKTRAPEGSDDAKIEQTPTVDESTSRAWHILRQWNCPPLLLGLTQQLAKVLEASQRSGPAWQEVSDGGTLRLKLEIEGDLPGEVTVGLFQDARWSGPPVAVRRLGAGTHVLTGLPAGQYQIGAMLGNAPVPVALGVHRTWPEPVEIKAGRTATTEVLVAEAFQKWGSGWYNEEVAKDYVGQWSDLDEDNLLQGQLTGPDGKPIPFGLVEILEHNPGATSRATADQGTNEQGVYKYDGMNWPYKIAAVWREAIPSTLGQRRQRMYLGRVLQGAQRMDFRFAPFPEGTAKVAGRVLDQNGKPVRGFFLRLHMPPFSDLDLSRMMDGYKTQVTYDVPFVSEEGRFELGGLPAGRATVDIVPFEVQRYQHERGHELGEDVVLETGQTTRADVELVGKGVFYGRVLFEDGTPAVIAPRPWRGAVTRIMMTFGFRAGGVGEVSPDGYFTLYLGDSDKEALAQDTNRLVVNVPTDQKNRWENAGEFPCEKLAEDKSKAGVVQVRRPQPTPTLPPNLRRGGPLPSGWRLGYEPHTGPERRRWTQVFLSTRLAAANASVEEQFELYGPDGKRVNTFGPRSALILDKAQRYILLCTLPGDRRSGDWPITRGPFLLDLSRPGRYTLTAGLSTLPEMDGMNSRSDANQDAARA